jgi:acylpyruvate hydrolase
MTPLIESYLEICKLQIARRWCWKERNATGYANGGDPTLWNPAMKIATVRQADGTTRAGRFEDEEIVLLPFADVGKLLASGVDWPERAGLEGPRIPLADAELSRLIPHPSKVLCVGRNYLEHIREGNPEAQPPVFPELFTKFPESLTGPYEDIRLPAGSGCADFREAVANAAKFRTVSLPIESDCVDWEAELVVLVGRAVRRTSEAEAEAAIAGFTVGNDISVRDWQFHSSQWTQGKAWEAMSPVGPVLVTADELGVRPDLQISCLVDGAVMQDARTSGMVFDPVELVSYFSRIVTLRPGDLIFTGSPSGIGLSRNPQVYLRPGQVMTTEVEGIGQMVNRLVAEELRTGERQEAQAAQPSP